MSCAVVRSATTVQGRCRTISACLMRDGRLCCIAPSYSRVSPVGNTCRLHFLQEIVLQSGQGEVQVAQLEGAVKQITAFAQGSRFKQLARCDAAALCMARMWML